MSNWGFCVLARIPLVVIFVQQLGLGDHQELLMFHWHHLYALFFNLRVRKVNHHAIRACRRVRCTVFTMGFQSALSTDGNDLPQSTRELKSNWLCPFQYSVYDMNCFSKWWTIWWPETAAPHSFPCSYHTRCNRTVCVFKGVDVE